LRLATCHPTRKHHAKGKCKSCYSTSSEKSNPATRQKRAVAAAKSRQDKAKQKDLYYRRTYGLTLVEVQAMEASQEGRCAICKNYDPKLHVDHHHDTNTVRGMLCGTCNRGIGALMECPDILLAALKYLIYWSVRYPKEADVRQK
jgi:hypothetical protein